MLTMIEASIGNKNIAHAQEKMLCLHKFMNILPFLIFNHLPNNLSGSKPSTQASYNTTLTHKNIPTFSTWTTISLNYFEQTPQLNPQSSQGKFSRSLGTLKSTILVQPLTSEIRTPVYLNTSWNCP